MLIKEGIDCLAFQLPFFFWKKCECSAPHFHQISWFYRCSSLIKVDILYYPWFPNFILEQLSTLPQPLGQALVVDSWYFRAWSTPDCSQSSNFRCLLYYYCLIYFNHFCGSSFSLGVLELMFPLLPATTLCYFDTITITLNLLFKFDCLISSFQD